MIIYRTMGVVFVSLVFALSFFVHDSAAQGLPEVPFIEKHAFPFECCQYGKWRAGSPLIAYSTEGDTSSVAFRIAVGDSFFASTGNIHMEKLGVVVVTKPVGAFVPGDTIYTLSYTGEGSIDVWHNGTESNVEIFWDTEDDVDSADVNIHDPGRARYSGVLVQRPLMIWWVQVRNSEGQDGWLRLVNTTVAGFAIDEQIDGMDGCG